jgi:hypothetical protein
MVGCVRAVSLISSFSTVGDSLLGRAGVEKLLLTIGASRYQTFEVSRWLVLVKDAPSNVAIRLITGMWAVLRWLGAQKAIGMAGTRDGQDQMLIRLGAQRIPGVLPIISARYGQTIVALWFDLSQPPSHCAALMDKMALTLELHDRGVTFPKKAVHDLNDFDRGSSTRSKHVGNDPLGLPSAQLGVPRTLGSGPRKHRPAASAEDVAACRQTAAPPHR